MSQDLESYQIVRTIAIVISFLAVDQLLWATSSLQPYDMSREKNIVIL